MSQVDANGQMNYFLNYSTWHSQLTGTNLKLPIIGEYQKENTIPLYKLQYSFTFQLESSFLQRKAYKFCKSIPKETVKMLKDTYIHERFKKNQDFCLLKLLSLQGYKAQICTCGLCFSACLPEILQMSCCYLNCTTVLPFITFIKHPWVLSKCF